jgi:hypothetical protein
MWFEDEDAFTEAFDNLGLKGLAPPRPRTPLTLEYSGPNRSPEGRQELENRSAIFPTSSRRSSEASWEGISALDKRVSARKIGLEPEGGSVLR